MEGIPPIEPFLIRLETLAKKMGEPDFYNDQREATAVSREHQHLSKLRDSYKNLEHTIEQIEENRKIIDENADPELVELAKEDIDALTASIEPLKNEILRMMIPPDPTDSRNTVVEIRAGTGGDEASLFAADLYRMYCRYADSKGWKVENLSSSESPAGGFKEICFLLSGEDVYRSMKYESGTHRVQRVPVTEASGRIHTSAATVAVLPEAEEFDVEISMNDIRKDIFCASGPGGQSVNTTYSAIRLTHIPTGIVVQCQDQKSQLKNFDKAFEELRTRVFNLEYSKYLDEIASKRKTMVSTGDRSAKIRTYNYPQGRITDHRINYTIYNLSAFMDGDIQDCIDHLIVAENAERLKESEL